MHIVLLACGLWVFTGPHPLEEKDEGSTDRQQLLCIVCVCVFGEMYNFNLKTCR
jgi:hypothetical protein